MVRVVRKVEERKEEVRNEAQKDLLGSEMTVRPGERWMNGIHRALVWVDVEKKREVAEMTMNHEHGESRS